MIAREKTRSANVCYSRAANQTKRNLVVIFLPGSEVRTGMLDRPLNISIIRLCSYDAHTLVTRYFILEFLLGSFYLCRFVRLLQCRRCCCFWFGLCFCVDFCVMLKTALRESRIKYNRKTYVFFFLCEHTHRVHATILVYSVVCISRGPKQSLVHTHSYTHAHTQIERDSVVVIVLWTYKHTHTHARAQVRLTQTRIPYKRTYHRIAL